MIIFCFYFVSIFIQLKAAGLHDESEFGSEIELSTSTTSLIMLLRFLLTVGSCASFMPSLKLVIGRKRHFEAFISIFQLFSALMFSASDALMTDRFFLLSRNDWHMISDITTETYLCLICIHLLGLRDENLMICLRYIAFAFCWIAKTADGWGSVAFEAIALGLFIFPPQVLLLQSLITGPIKHLFDQNILPSFISQFLDRKYNCDSSKVPKAMGSGFIAILFLILENQFYFGKTDIKVFSAIAHCGFGMSTYYMWQLVPCYDRSDDMPMFK